MLQIVTCRCAFRGGGDRPPKTYESNLIRHDFVQLGKQHSRYKAILSSIVLSQQCCEAYFISLTVMKSLWDLTSKYYWNRPPSQTWWLDPPIVTCERGEKTYTCSWYAPGKSLTLQGPFEVIIRHSSRTDCARESVILRVCGKCRARISSIPCFTRNVFILHYPTIKNPIKT